MSDASSSMAFEVRRLLERAASTLSGTAPEAVAVLTARLNGPLRVAIAGRVKAGKSTLLNALVGQELAPTDAGECTRVVTWYEDGLTYAVVAELVDGTRLPLPFEFDSGVLGIDLGAIEPPDVDRLVVTWPASALRRLTLIDTPGTGSLSAALSETATRLLVDDDGERPADAVIYLMRHLHRDDVDFLDAFRDQKGAATSVNAIGVLSRADELGGGRTDSMESAARVADRYRRDPTLRRLCQTVVPVAGLLAQAAVTLTEREVHALRAVATAPAADAAALLLSADRFAHAATSIPLVEEERRRLLARFGLFGVRRCREVLASKPTMTASQLSTELRRESGLEDLQRIFETELTARRDVLKSHSVMVELEQLLRADPGDDARDVLDDLERVQAGSHEFAELRVLTALRAGQLAIDDEEALEVERVMASGRSAHERAGVSADADAETVRQALYATVARWQKRGQHPLSDTEVAEAARVVVRTCEGMVAALSQEALGSR